MALLLPEVGLLFWMSISFGIVLVILSKFGFPIITGMVNKRKSYIDESLNSAQEANEKLIHLQEEAAKIVNEANREQGRILRQAQEEKNSIIRDARKEARILAKQELDEVKDQIQKEKDEAIRAIRRQVAILSVDIAEKVIRKNLDTEPEQMEMIDRMLDEVMAREN